jgi:cyanophycinase
LLVLNGGDEFNPGNEEQDRMLARAVGRGPAFVVPTAAARQGPERAVAHATAWFERFDLEVKELAVLKRTDANSRALAEQARAGGFFYLVGGDPGLVVQVLEGTRVWTAIFQAWRDGAALAGSSAGAMALCSHTLIRAGWPDRTQRRSLDALGVVAKTAVLPHYETFGHRWMDSARRALPGVTLLGIDERTAAVWSSDDDWQAAGAGAVTVIKGATSERFTSGMKVAGLPGPARMLPSHPQ